MRTITHKVRCSGTYHTVWYDTEGILHRTCNGEGCTLAFEAARALLRGMPDKEPGRAHNRGRYSAAWGEPWENVKRRAWQIRAARRRTRGEPVGHVGDFDTVAADTVVDADLLPALALLSTKQRITSDLVAAVVRDLVAAEYTKAKSCLRQPRVHTTLDLRVQPNVLSRFGVAWVEKVQHEFRQNGRRFTTNDTRRCYTSAACDVLHLRAALGGTNLVDALGKRLFAAALLEDHRHTTGEVVVLVMRQGRGLVAHCEPAVVRRTGERAELVRWESWRNLSDRAVAPYATFLRTAAASRNSFYAHETEALVMCLQAMHGRLPYDRDPDAQVRHEVVQPWAISVIHGRRRECALVSAIDTLPGPEDITAAYSQFAVDTKEYAAKWGDAIGCDRSCALFDNNGPYDGLTISQSWRLCQRPIHQEPAAPPISVGPFLVPRDSDAWCALLSPLQTLIISQRRRVDTIRELRVLRNDLREITRLVTRAGFIVKASGALEELPCP